MKVLDLAAQFFTAMVTLALMSLGTGMFSTSQSVWLHSQKFSPLIIGIIISSYFLGFVYASFHCEKLILRVSHIRAYSTFAALLCSLFILQGLFMNPWAWIVLRLLAGYCTAGLFIVIESWLLCQSKPKVRGMVMALYMLVYYGGMAFGQLLLNLGVSNILRLFSIAAMCTALSIIPLALTTIAQPKIEIPSTVNFFKLFKESPSGVMGCFFSGLILGPLYGLFPLYLANTYHQNKLIAALMFAIIFGGMFFQIPFGKLSDRIGRKKMLLVCFVILLLTSLMFLFPLPNIYAVFALCFMFGGAAFAVYPISMAYACDVIEEQDMVSAAQSLVLAMSLGMIIGPLIASLSIWLLYKSHGLIDYFLQALVTLKYPK